MGFAASIEVADLVAMSMVERGFADVKAATVRSNVVRRLALLAKPLGSIMMSLLTPEEICVYTVSSLTQAGPVTTRILTPLFDAQN
jgi:hypothetical protein